MTMLRTRKRRKENSYAKALEEDPLTIAKFERADVYRTIDNFGVTRKERDRNSVHRTGGRRDLPEDSRHTPPLPTRAKRWFLKVSSFKMWAR